MTEDNHMPDDYKAGDEIWVHPESWAVKKLPPDNKWWHEQGMVSYTRTELYTAVVAERDELAEKLRKSDEAFTVAQDLINRQYGTIKQLRAVLQNAVAGQWQPIETAPNMEDCLIYSNREIFSAYKNKQGQWIAPDPHGVGQCFILNMPTHWMPLPAPPKNANE